MVFYAIVSLVGGIYVAKVTINNISSMRLQCCCADYQPIKESTTELKPIGWALAALQGFSLQLYGCRKIVT